MANKAFKAHAKSSEAGSEVVVHQQETDSPVLPVAQLEHLHTFRPDLVDFVVEETRNEAKHRRALESRGYWLMFTERIFGQVCAVVVAIIGMGGAIYLGMNGQPLLGGTIATAMISGLAAAFIVSKRAQAQRTSTRKP